MQHNINVSLKEALYLILKYGIKPKNLELQLA